MEQTDRGPRAYELAVYDDWLKRIPVKDIARQHGFNYKTVYAIVARVRKWKACPATDNPGPVAAHGDDSSVAGDAK